jgi:hypothetical protein
MQAIEVATGHKTCIVYGALPAETRRHQVGVGQHTTLRQPPALGLLCAETPSFCPAADLAATTHVCAASPSPRCRHQARLFNNPASGVNVLIASDAIGLGLNFNIRCACNVLAQAALSCVVWARHP